MSRAISQLIVLAGVCLAATQGVLQAERDGVQLAVGDPQIRTDHPWFPGELSCSTFERLFETQADLCRRQTGRGVATEEDKVIASWYWRNLNYYHAYCPREAFWGDEITSARESARDAVLDYWTGLFGYGFSLCYTTHRQYTAEMEKLLGHGRARSVDVDGHTSFEVFLKDAQYGATGDWVLLDHDISTIVFDDSLDPKRLINVSDIAYKAQPNGLAPRTFAEREAMLDNSSAPNGNRGWFKSGLYFPSEDTSDANQSDAIGVYTKIRGTAPLSGYVAVPPIVSIRRGETIRRYLKPGLGDKTYVYWGPNYLGINKGRDSIPGPSRDRTWAAQPERMYRATRDTDLRFARYGNVVYTYQPNFADGSYRDGVIAEDERSVTFYFYSPYAIAASWKPIVADWRVKTMGYQAGEISPRSFCFGGLDIAESGSAEVLVHFSNNGGITFERAEVYLIYRADSGRPVLVTFDWNERTANQIVSKTASHTFEPVGPRDVLSWNLETGNVVQTNWVQTELARSCCPTTSE